MQDHGGLVPDGQDVLARRGGWDHPAGGLRGGAPPKKLTEQEIAAMVEDDEEEEEVRPQPMPVPAAPADGDEGGQVWGPASPAAPVLQIAAMVPEEEEPEVVWQPQEPFRTWQEDLHYQLRLGELQQQELANQAFLEEDHLEGAAEDGEAQPSPAVKPSLKRKQEGVPATPTKKSAAADGDEGGQVWGPASPNMDEEVREELRTRVDTLRDVEEADQAGPSGTPTKKSGVGNLKVYGSPDMCIRTPKRKLIPEKERQLTPMDLSSPAKQGGVFVSPGPGGEGAQGLHQDLPEQDLPEQDLPEQDLPEQGRQEPDVTVTVMFYPSHVPNLEFLGQEGTKEWDEKSIKDFYFLSPNKTPQCLRAQFTQISMKEIMDSVYHRLRLNMEKPFLTFEGKVVGMETPLDLFSHNSAFIILDTQIPDKYMDHAGKLWQCWVCMRAYTKKEKFAKLSCKGSKKDARHKFFFFDDQENKIPVSWGRMTGDRKGNKPWGCPAGHGGLRGAEQVPAGVQARVQGMSYSLYLTHTMIFILLF